MGFVTERDARAALHRELDRLARRRLRRAVTLPELVEEYLDQHEAEPETTAKLRRLLSKSVARFGRARSTSWSPGRSPRGG